MANDWVRRRDQLDSEELQTIRLFGKVTEEE